MKSFLFSILILSVFLSGCSNDEITLPATQESLVLWTTEAPEYWKAIAKEFDLQNKDTVLDFEVKVFSNEDELQNKLLNNLAEGSSPDLVVIDINWITNNKKKLLSLRKDESLSSQKFKKEFLSIVHNLTNDENVWGIPLNIKTPVLIINKNEIQNQSGEINIKTWDQIVYLSKKLTQIDNSFSRIKQSTIAIGTSDNVNLHKELPALLSNQKDKTIDFLKSFNSPSSDNFSWNDLQKNDLYSFAEGKTLMVLGFPSDKNKILEIIKQKELAKANHISSLDIEIATFPQFDLQNKKLLVTGKAITIPFPSTKKKIGQQFLKFLINSDFLKVYQKETGLPSPYFKVHQENLLKENEMTILSRQLEYAEIN